MPRKRFRWRAIVPLLLLLVAVGVGYYLLADRLARNAVAEAGTEFLGTQVDIAWLHILESEGAVEVGGLAVADPFNPSRNMVQADRIRIQLDPAPLLEKKLVIKELSIGGVRVGTKREVPARPVEGGGFAPEMVRSLTAWKQQFDVPLLSLTPIDTLRSIVVNPSQLATVAQAERIRAATDSVRRTLGDRIDGLRLAPTLDSAKALAERLAQTNVTKLGIAGTQRAVADVRSTLSALEDAKRRVDAVKAAVDQGAVVLRSEIARLDEARRQDYAMVRGLVGLPNLEGPAIGNAMFGDVSLSYFQRASYWANLAVKYLPPGLRPRATPGPARLRRSGTTVRFPKEHEYPTFLVERGQVDLELPGTDEEYAARIQDLTTAPGLVGRPTRVTIGRIGGSGPLAVQGSAVLDHNGHIRDSVVAQVRGLPIPGFAIPGLPFRVEPGRGTTSLSGTLRGDTVAAVLTLAASNVQWVQDSTGAALGPGPRLLWEVVRGLGDLSITARLSGTLTAPRIEVRSNLDQAVANRLRSLAGEAATKALARVRAEVDRLHQEHVQPVVSQATAVRADLEQRVAQMEERVETERTALEARLKSLTAGVGGIRLP